MSMWVSEGKCVLVAVVREDEGRRWSQENVSCCEQQGPQPRWVWGRGRRLTWTGLALQVDVFIRFLRRAWHLGRGMWDQGFDK